MPATIIYSPQFKDRVLAKMTSDEILTKTLAAKFPDHHIEDVRGALRSLRKFGVVDYRSQRQGQTIQYFWRRV